ncbi:bile acid:sodium symporter family protein [Janibacter alittae]|uniref:Bile acid:sodium symporter n=1 Tax=Janibacter alittae TaxID=3115209 RepID=A0ABZ2MD55_9MICO
MTEVLTVITQVGILSFVVAGMLGMGLSLSLREITAPLSDSRLVVGALVANFIVVPAAAIAIGRLLPMGDATSTAVILVGCCAGAPFLPTLAKLSHGSQPLAVGTMVLLMVVTVAFAPLVVPLAVDGAQVSARDIAQSLILFMLVPLAVGLLVRARYPHAADAVVAGCNQASTVGLSVGIVSALLVTWREVFASVGSWVFIGTVLIIVVGLAAGWVGGLGHESGDRMVLGLAAAQRNISAALVIAASLGGDVVVQTLVAALTLPIVLILMASEIGKRNEPARG